MTADQATVDKLTARCASLLGVTESAITWIDQAATSGSPRLISDRPALIEEMRRIRLSAKRLQSSTRRPPAIGLFGPSQAGKSYLVSSIARVPNGRLVTRLGSRTADFLRDINPGGGRESTGVVTRFTIHEGAAPPEFPVEVRLLSEADIVKILGNSFFNDFDREKVDLHRPDAETVRNRLSELKAAASTSSTAARPIPADEVYSIRAYFEQEFSNSMDAFKADYWPAAMELGPRLGTADRVRLFSLLWWDFAPFTELYARLCSALERLSHADSAYCALETLIPRDLDGKPQRVGSIIDVQILNGLRSDSTDMVSLRPVVSGQVLPVISIGRPLLAALVAELRITLTERPWPFLDTLDLLDFPGARSRLKITSLQDVEPARNVTTDIDPTAELLLRGKVAYLFERFTEDREMAAVLLCVPWGPQEVSGYPPLIDRWVRATCGESSEARQSRPNGLFVVFTKFDIDLQEKGGDTEESERRRWPDRLRTSLLEKFERYDWISDWDGKPFRNVFWLRNPEMPNSPYMNSENGRETGIRESQRERLDRLKGFFIADPLVQKHFSEPANSWDAALAPGDGGVMHIIRNLTPLTDMEAHWERMAGATAKLVDRISGRLRQYYIGENQEERQQKAATFKKLRAGLTSCMREKKFGELNWRLHPDKEELRSLYFTVASGAGPERSVDGTTADTADFDDYLNDVLAGSHQRATRIHPRARAFAERAIQHWISQLRAMSDNMAATDILKIHPDVLDILVDELIVGAHRLGLVGAIGAALEPAEQNAGARWEAIVDRQIIVTAAVIGEFIDYLGYARLPLEKRPGVPPISPLRRVFQPSPPFQGLPPLTEKPQPVADLFAIDWVHAFEQLMLSNAGYAENQEIPAPLNQALGLILRNVATPTF